MLADWYIYRCILRRADRVAKWKKFHLLTSGFLYMILIGALINIAVSVNDTGLVVSMWLIFTFFSVYIPKYIFIIFDLIARIPKIFHRHRIRIVSTICVIAGFAVMGIFWWGALFNRTAIDVKDVTVEIKNLPESFNDYKIVQISDLHVGSFLNDTTFVSKIVEHVNREEPDLILFTGDMVNRHSEEMEEFAAPLANLKAKDGAFAILGNHDYADYYPEYRTDGEKEVDVERLRDLYGMTAFNLLEDESRVIERGKDKIVLIGVGNIGKGPFPVYGSLNKAYPTLNDSEVKILMSHDPSHWQDSIMNNPATNIDLTLSGHTHAMQMDIAGFSPARYYHKMWKGLHHDDLGRQLYINIGSGTVGIPARIGATPEITVITLKKK